MYAAEKRRKFRALLASGQCYYPGSVFDALSARIAEDLGFEMGMLGGSVASLAVLGAPDLIVLTLTEFADLCRRICRAGDLPLIVDADHGYGNALNVKRTVEELEVAGIAALTIEDTLLPRPFGQEKVELISIDEGVGKMKAALAGRQDREMVIIGRSSAIALNGLEDGIARAKAYEAAGVDALFMLGMKNPAQLEAISSAVKIPLMTGYIDPKIVSRETMAKNRVRICLQGHQPIAAGYQAVHTTLKAIRDGVAPDKLPNLPSEALTKHLSRDADYAAWTKAFLDPAR